MLSISKAQHSKLRFYWGVVNHGLMISFITLTCKDDQQLNKQYDHNDFQVDVSDSIGVSKIYP